MVRMGRRAGAFLFMAAVMPACNKCIRFGSWSRCWAKRLNVKHADCDAEAEADGENGQAVKGCQAHEVVPPSLLIANASSDKCAVPTITPKG
jgi:hypothetical protein